MQTISSPYTFFYKFILPSIWFAGFGFGTRKVLFSPDFANPQWLPYVATWLGITVCIIFATGFVKTVTIDRKEKKLTVSNFLRTITIDFNEIEDIDGSSFLSPKQVWFTTSTPTVFGTKIAFLPGNRPRQKLGKHPMVMELRQEFKLDQAI